MKKKLKDALHRYKVEAFKMTHNTVEGHEDVSKEILEHTGEALQNAYHFHFDEKTSPHRVETFQMIKSVMLETILPPVVEKVMRRVTVLEHQNQQLVQLHQRLYATSTDNLLYVLLDQLLNLLDSTLFGQNEFLQHYFPIDTAMHDEAISLNQLLL